MSCHPRPDLPLFSPGSGQDPPKCFPDSVCFVHLLFTQQTFPVHLLQAGHWASAGIQRLSADEGRRPQGSQISVAEIKDCPQRVVNGGLEVRGGMKYKGGPQSSWGGVRKSPRGRLAGAAEAQAEPRGSALRIRQVRRRCRERRSQAEEAFCRKPGIWVHS